MKFITFRYPSKSLTLNNLIRTRIRWQIDSFKKSFLQGQKLSFSNFFPTETIEAIIAHTPHKRTSVFSPLITLQAFIFQVLSDDSSCKLVELDQYRALLQSPATFTLNPNDPGGRSIHGHTPSSTMCHGLVMAWLECGSRGRMAPRY